MPINDAYDVNNSFIAMIRSAKIAKDRHDKLTYPSPRVIMSKIPVSDSCRPSNEDILKDNRMAIHGVEHLHGLN